MYTFGHELFFSLYAITSSCFIFNSVLGLGLGLTLTIFQDDAAK